MYGLELANFLLRGRRCVRITFSFESTTRAPRYAPQLAEYHVTERPSSMPVPTPQPSESRWIDDLARLLRQSVGKTGQGLPSSSITGKIQNTKDVDP